MQKMTVRVISSTAFDSLPYKYVREAFGVADTKEGVAYIRDLGNVDATQAVMEHEIDELDNLFGDMDEPIDEPGIKYKSFFRSFGKTFVGKYVVPAALFAIPGVGPALAATYSAVNAYQKESTPRAAIMGGIEGLASGVGGQGVVGGVKAGLTAGAKGGLMAGAKAVLPGMAAGLKTGLIALPGITPGMFAGGATGAGTASGAGAGSSLLTGSGAPSTGLGATLYGGAAPATGYTAGGIGAGTGLSAGLPSIGQTATGTLATGSLAKTLGGFGIAALGNALVKTPQVPDISGITETLKPDKSGAISPIGTLGLEKLTNRLNTPTGTLPEEYKTAQLANFDRAYTDAKNNLIDQYKALRPNADIETDSAFRRDMMKLENDFAKEKTNLLANLEYQNQQSQLTQQAQDIQQALNIDQNTFQKYAEIAQLNLDKIMLEYGLSYGEAQSFKDIFSSFGSLVMQSGLGL